MEFWWFMLGMFWARLVFNWKPKQVWEQISADDHLRS